MKDENIVWHNQSITKEKRLTLLNQKPCILWFTGLSGSGKSTIANAVELELFKRGRKTYLLDGDNVRHGLNKDLGFSEQDRIENIRRIGEVAKLFVDSGLIVLTAFISPFKSDRQIARSLVKYDEFIEVFIDTPLEVCEQRDPKGLYKKARDGAIKNFTGISSPYEAPEEPQIHIKTDEHSIEECVDIVINYLIKFGYVKEIHDYVI
ncbi:MULTISPECIES: adenylyl-sulfate kinase [Aliarcobacter]|uniref:adenylyl-sulfate kinase n=1 Tax=Aliarcobacter TaxID=2321111 RepID=UPI00082D4DC1|nr:MULTISPECIES: adenylyl-sulfate kinase [Aliarcobacter]PWE19134.1 adenylyl-sulfate kinase [Aliarcobacter skirrowii]PWE25191.1 adenylyl-sulfate kinase [Aliarcobacter skirrowii]RJO55038.1 adenylyl-sulfate kinase [Aliarcobacter skirrowii]RJO57041.1 adenylyl-sulfate kinase [Aliarcobacter skirrowii]